MTDETQPPPGFEWVGTAGTQVQISREFYTEVLESLQDIHDISRCHMSLSFAWSLRASLLALLGGR